ncbi:hypothetical protein [Coprobacter tertius]|uniref:Uncharacterized protein n=1 Tax=Coprobacter tertius TaxID=2944915 RepID=A0ABT1MIS9_9BACT|nr:hypothetical protein [Coprobacter tertius]MCP9611136.1 hypothetical protein [Coprobacter tertius]
MKLINKDSDFTAFVQFTDAAGSKISVPEYDFILEYETDGFNKYVASKKDGVYSNCRLDGDRLLVVFNDHGLDCGLLRQTLFIGIPNEVFPDGLQHIRVPQLPGIELWGGKSDNTESAEITVLPVYQKGEKGDKGDKGDPGVSADLEATEKATQEAIAAAEEIYRLKDEWDERLDRKFDKAGGEITGSAVIDGTLTTDDLKSVNNSFRAYVQGGESYGEFDHLLVRVNAVFNKITVSEIQSVGGRILVSLADMKAIRVEERTDSYRCYFNNDEGRLSNLFVKGDQARCQRFNGGNIKSYWRLVTGIGADYIDLSKTDAQESGIPAEGDVIVQLGNRNDVSRQAAIEISAFGSEAPSIKQYAGINNFSLTGKETTVISPAGNSFTGDFKLSSGKTVIEATQDLIDNLQIGSRNYFRKDDILLLNETNINRTGDYEFLVETAVPHTDNNYSIRFCNRLTGSENAGKIFTFSTTIKNTGSSVLRFSLGITGNGSREIEVAAGEIVRVDTTAISSMQLSEYGVYCDMSIKAFSTFVVNEWKIETGNRATDWSPAPEDVQEQINTIIDDDIFSAPEKKRILPEWNAIVAEKESLLQTADKYGIITQKSDYMSAYSSLYGYMNPLMSTLDTDSPADGVSFSGARFRELFTVFYNARNALYRAIEGMSKDLIDDVQVGSRNYFLKSDEIYQIGTVFNRTDDYEISVVSANVPTGDNYSFRFANRLKGSLNVGKTFTFSITIKNTGNTTLKLASRITDNETQEVLVASGTTERLKVTAISSEAAATQSVYCDLIVLEFSAFTMSEWKLESGNRATDWSPAPEDILFQIDTIVDDDIFSATEKKKLLPEWSSIVNERTSLEQTADKYNIVTEKANYISAYNSLYNYINPLMESPDTDSPGDGIPFTGVNFRSLFTVFYNSRNILYRTIEGKAKDLVDNISIGGRNYFCKNDEIYYQDITYERNSDYKISVSSAVPRTDNNFSIRFCNRLTGNLYMGETFTFSAQIKNTGTSLLKLASRISNNSFQEVQVASGMSSRIKVTGISANIDTSQGVFCDIAVLASSAFTISEWKIETGNKATDWSPSPEDMQEQIDTIIDDDIFSSAEKKQLLPEWTSIVNERNSLISMAEKYLITTEKESYDAVYNSLYTYLNPLMEKADSNSPADGVSFTGSRFRELFIAFYDARNVLYRAIENKTKDMVDDLQIGGRNYFRKNDTILLNFVEIERIGDYKIFVSSASTSSSNYALRFCNQLTGSANVGKSFTFSTTITNTGDYTLQLGISIAGQPEEEFLIPSRETNRISVTAVSGTSITSNGVYCDVGVREFSPFIIKEWKIERGTKATDWEPSLDDLQDQIETIVDDDIFSATEKKQLLPEWTSIVNEKIPLSQMADKYAIVTEKTNYQNAYTALYNYVNPLMVKPDTDSPADGAVFTGSRFRELFTTFYTQRNTLYREIESKAKELVDNVAVGGRNYFRKSDYIQENEMMIERVSDYELRSTSFSKTPVGGYSLRFYNSLTGKAYVGETYTFSVTVNNTGSDTLKLSLDITDKSSTQFVITSGESKRISITSVAGGFAETVCVFCDILVSAYSAFTLKNWKLETGNKATDWTPSPEDVDDSIAGKVSTTLYNSDLTKTNEEINLRATKTELNALGQRVSTAEASITTQAGQIAMKVNKDDVVSAINILPENIKIDSKNISLNGDVVAKAIETNGLSVGNGKFHVGSDGVLKAEGAEIVGKVEASTGKIGGFNIQGGDLINVVENNGVTNASIILTNNEGTKFMGVGGNVAPSYLGHSVLARFEDTTTDVEGIGHYAVMAKVANGYNNIALSVTGGVDINLGYEKASGNEYYFNRVMLNNVRDIAWGNGVANTVYSGELRVFVSGGHKYLVLT